MAKQYLFQKKKSLFPNGGGVRRREVKKEKGKGEGVEENGREDGETHKKAKEKNRKRKN